MKAQLAVRVSNVTDTQMALSHLRQVRRKPVFKIMLKEFCLWRKKPTIIKGVMQQRHFCRRLDKRPIKHENTLGSAQHIARRSRY